MKKILVSFLFLATLGTSPALAQRVDQLPPSHGSFSSMGPSTSTDGSAIAPTIADGIVAVVNESIISLSDLRSRMGLAILSAGIPGTPDVQQKLLPQVLRSLIDEQIQIQEGKKTSIAVSDEEIQHVIEDLATENKIPGGDMMAFLRAHGVSPQTLRNQVRATLTWHKVLGREVRPRIDIGDDEVETAIARIRANAGKQEFLISEIFLAVESPAEEPQIKTLAEKLVEQIKGGAPFGAAARQFSQGLGAATGGDMGWIQQGQLASEIDKVLPMMDKGTISEPLRSASGYHIIGLRDKRTISLSDAKETTIKLEQLFHPFSAKTQKEDLLREAAALRNDITDCSTIKKVVSAQFPAWRHTDLGEVKLDTAPAWLSEKIQNIPEGHSSDAMATDKGALILFVCGRSAPENFDRDAIRNAIGSEKMELMARRLLRDLRKNAFIDIRLK